MQYFIGNIFWKTKIRDNASFTKFEYQKYVKNISEKKNVGSPSAVLKLS